MNHVRLGKDKLPEEKSGSIDFKCAISKRKTARLGGLSVEKTFAEQEGTARVDIAAGVIVCIQLGGQLRLSRGETPLEHEVGAMVLVEPQPYQQTWTVGTQWLTISASAVAVSEGLAAYLGRNDQHLAFQAVDLDPDDPSVLRLVRLAETLTLEQLGTDASIDAFGKAAERLCIIALIEAISRRFGNQAFYRRGGPSPRHVKLAIDYMKQHISESLDIVSLAREAGVSVRTLQRGFQQFKNASPAQILSSLRIEQARAWLENPHNTRSLDEIRVELGYNSYQSFWRMYSTNYNETPSATRKRALQETWSLGGV